MITQVFIRNTDSCFFEADDYLFGDESAIEEAKENYLTKYPDELENIDTIVWDIVESEILNEI